jgi:hypothetical protein
MSKKMQNVSHPLHDKKYDAHVTTKSLPSSKRSTNNEITISNNGWDFKGMAEKSEREANMQSKQSELNDCVEFVSQLVDLLKHTVIIPELQSEDDWHDDIGHQLKRNKGTIGNSLDGKVEQIAVRKGLTTEQWRQLLYVNLTAGDYLEMTNVSRSHLKKVHDMASRLLEGEERTTTFALIDAIERYMPSSHFIDK